MALQPIVPTWPLARWWMVIVGPLPIALRGYRFTIVVVEYFSKWVQAEPLTAIRALNVIKFFRKNLVRRFAVPRELTVDNGK